MQSDERIVPGTPEAYRTLSRREFARILSATAAGGIGMAFAGCSLTASQKAEAGEAIVDGLGIIPKVKLSKRLGGMTISRVCIIQDGPRDLIQPQLDAGMNFIHKAGYWGRRGGLPEEIKKLPRESFFVDSTVDNTSPGHDPTNEEEAYNQVNSELEATGLKYVDIFRAHYGWRTKDSFNKGDNASYKAFLRLKKEGKARYFGVSQHTQPEQYEPYTQMIQAQIDSGLVDSMQVWCSYATKPEDLAIFEKAHKAGISITAMKVNAHGAGKMGADVEKQKELKAEGKVHRAAIRYVLNLPYVDTCVSRMGNFDMLEENLGAIATKVASRDGFIIRA